MIHTWFSLEVRDRQECLCSVFTYRKRRDCGISALPWITNVEIVNCRNNNHLYKGKRELWRLASVSLNDVTPAEETRTNRESALRVRSTLGMQQEASFSFLQEALTIWHIRSGWASSLGAFRKRPVRAHLDGFRAHFKTWVIWKGKIQPALSPLVRLCPWTSWTGFLANDHLQL